jgi:large subunit ribosomal protein L11
MSKEKLVNVKLVILAGKANPAPPIGTALGPKGVNLMNFCKQFNEETARLGIEVGEKVAVEITVYKDKSFTFIIKTPPTTELIKKYSGVKKGSSATKKEAYVGEITLQQCREIAGIKMKDLNTQDIDAAVNMVIGSAESMGLKILR